MQVFCKEICSKALWVHPTQIDVSEMESVYSDLIQSGSVLNWHSWCFYPGTADIDESQRSASYLLHPYLFMLFADDTDLLSWANVIRSVSQSNEPSTVRLHTSGGHNVHATSSEPALSQRLGKLH